MKGIIIKPIKGSKYIFNIKDCAGCIYKTHSGHTPCFSCGNFDYSRKMADKKL